MCEALLFINSAVLFTLFGFVLYGFHIYIRLSRRLTHIAKAMDCEELLDQLLLPEEQEKPDACPPKESPLPQHRARLAALVAGGSAKEYIGKQLTLSQIDELSDDEVEQLYSRYEARLGATMTRTLGSSALRLYTMLASTFLPIPHEKQASLEADLDADPFVNHALTTACCELYHRYGAYLAPLTAALTTAKHCEFRQEVTCDKDGAPRDGDGASYSHTATN